jgi:PAS domain S-box-containing protein
MSQKSTPPPAGADDEISALIATLHATEDRLEELTGREVDTVSDAQGRQYLLRRAQRQWRDTEADKQAAILNALPEHIALLDAQGAIVSVNRAWRQLATANFLQGPEFAIGINYPEACRRAAGGDALEARRAADGILSVLAGAPFYSLEYACHSPLEKRWFLMMVTPMTSALAHGVVVMHTNITARRQAEQALKEAKIAAILRESAERYNFLADTVPLIIWTARPDGGLDYYNRSWFEYTGLARERTNRWGWDAFVHPDDLARCLERWARSFTTGEAYESESRFKRGSDGAYRWFLGRALPLRDAEGQILQWVGTATDIDEQKRAEAALLQVQAELENRVATRTEELSLSNQALRQQQAEMRLLFDLIPAMILFKDTENRILKVNRRVAEAAGLPVEAIEGRSALEIYPRSTTDYYAADLEVIRSGTPKLGYIDTTVGPDGQPKWFLTDTVPVPDHTGRTIGVVIMAQDITERKQAELALRLSEQRFRAMFDQAAVGVAQADANAGRFVQVNQRLCEILGYAREELESLSLSKIAYPPDVADILALKHQLNIGAIREFTAEKRFRRKDGSEVWLSLTVSAMWAPGEAPDHFIAIAQDITERKRLDQRFLQAQKMEALGQFSGGVAHDFNNILGAIGGYAELTRMQLAENPEACENLDAVLQSTHRATDLVRQILTFSRQESQERQVIDLRPVIVESLKLMRSSVPAMIEFDTQLAADAPTILGNVNQIHQVLMNLGTNAWHAMKNQAGRLQTKLERLEIAAAPIAAQPGLRPGVYAHISISDTGTGMDPATLRRIFEPFFTTKPPGEGTGLGMAVVHGIMESHDGTITVHSEPGEGTVFHLYFPAAAGEAAATVPAATATPRGQGERILIVDDEELLLRLSQKALTALGYVVETATHPAAALAMVRADPRRYALVLTDQTMPGMTGLALAEELLRIRPGLPVILMTGYSPKLTSESIRAMGLSEFLVKPVSLQSLGATVRAALSNPPPS